MTSLDRRDFLIKLLSATAVPMSATTTSAWAQGTYPSKPVTLLVPQPAGGDADAFCRAIQPKMQESLGQAVIIDNRGGAAGNIGTSLGVRAPADGYTVTFVNQGTMAINPHLYPNPGYLVDQFVPVTHLASIDLLICVHPSVRATTLQELLDLARKSPGALNYGTAGSGSANHLAGELLKSMTGVELTHIPFKGGGPAIAATLGGDVQIVVAFPLAVMAHIKAGKLRALATTGERRATALPDVPTVAEAGVKGYEFSSWFGLMLPKGTPDEIVRKVNAASTLALKTPAIAEKLLAGLTRPVASSPKEFADLIARESARWGKLIRQLNIKLD